MIRKYNYESVTMTAKEQHKRTDVTPHLNNNSSKKNRNTPTLVHMT